MSRFRHSLSLAMIAVIACASFAIAPHAQVAQAAGPFVVNTATDPFPADGVCAPLGVGAAQSPDGCTLREALALANADKTTDMLHINFDIPQGNANPALNTVPGYAVTYPYGSAFPLETWTITLTRALPFITRGNIDVNGFSQEDNTPGTSNFTLGPVMVVDGKNLSSNTSGFTLFSDGNMLRGLVIDNFSQGTPGVGIDVQGSNNTIQGNYIGTDKAALTSAPNTIGIRLTGRGIKDNLIGGDNTQAAQRNIISGNNAEGIRIEFGVEGNNKIRGNYIGLNLSGVSDVGNKGDGIYIYASSGNLIGALVSDTVTNFANVISGNDRNGILIQDSSNNNVYGNLIGTNTNGAVAVANSGDGVKIESAAGSATNNSIGVPHPDKTKFKVTRNVISGNGFAGIRITGENTSGNTVFNNYIGPSSGGASVTGVYSQTGVVVDEGADRNQIGGGGENEGNVIAGNNGAGVRIAGLKNATTTLLSDDNIVSGNTIIDTAVGTQATPYTPGSGIVVDTYASRTRIGGNGTGEGNRVENNGGDGIQLTGTSIISNTVLGNTVRANIGNGVRVNPVTTAMTTTLSNNVIELNGGDGMQIAGAINTTIFSNTIEANGFIGEAASGTGGTGIQITRGVSTTIDATRVISNALNGISLATSDRGRITNSVINGNGSTPLTNTLSAQLNGIVVASSNIISITNNTVLSNTLDGVLIGDALFGSKQVRVTDNSISANGGLGINLDPETIDAPGIANNPNHDIDAPFNLHVNQDGLVTGRVLAIKNQPASCLNCTIQVFATNPELLDGQGKTKYTSSVEISANGYFTTTVGTVPNQLALTATDDKGNTSEFGVFTVNYGGLTDTLGLDIGPARAGAAAPSEVISYTHRITNTSNIDYTDLSLSAVSNQGWTTAVAPAAPITLAAGQSKPVTLTLTLPKAPNKSVLAGTIDLTRLTIKSTKAVSATASVTDTTTVLSAFKLEVDPLGANGRVLPGKVITYSHTLRNVGNLTGTLVLSASTTPTTGWTTNITPTTITLGPGQEDSVRIGVGSPAGAVEGTTARTTVGIQITDPAGQAPISFVDTTRVSLQPLVTIVPNNEGEVEAGQTITFRHFVTNESNGPITLKLTARKTGLGSTVEFRSATAGVTLSPDGTFTLAKGAQLELLVDITVPERARAGSSDLVTISLSQEDGTLVGSVQDTVKVTANAFLPALYLPLIRK